MNNEIKGQERSLTTSSLNQAVFYCKARRKRLKQKEFKGKHKTLLSEKKIKKKQR